MALTPGSRLGPFEILSAIGAGGMGEVYRARDTRLDRTVAIKVLPAHVAADPQFRERFDREAKIISQLNHPHICTLYDVGHERLRPARGAGGERGDAAPPSASERGWGPASAEEVDVDYLVLEYLEGETLASRLGRAGGANRLRQGFGGPPELHAKAEAPPPPFGSGRPSGPPITLDQALQYGIQICDALDKAHRQGIVHRDLKPGNVMLTRSGGPSGPPVAKLLDFGLAKTATGGANRLRQGFGGPPELHAKAEAPPLPHGTPQVGRGGPSGPPDLTAPPTVTSPFRGAQGEPLTAQGTILGTFQYMPPEQLEGQEADARSDIWAFGCVLYEMLTGKKAFEGKTQASLIASILDRDPAPVSSFLHPTPPALDSIVRGCLAKDPDSRWQNAHDVELQLRAVAEAASQPDSGWDAAARSRRKRRERLLLAATLVLAITTLTVAGLAVVRRGTTELERISFNVDPPEDTVISPGPAAPQVAVSPDGRHLAFAATDANGKTLVWVRSLGSLSAQVLAGTEGASFPFWSPDSRSVGFFISGKLKRIDVTGGPAQTVCDASEGQGGTWSREGVIVFTPSLTSGLFRVPAAGGVATPLTALDSSRQERAHAWPQFLPDGRRFLYLALSAQPEHRALYVGWLDSTDTTRLLGTELRAAYAATPSGVVGAAEGYLLFQREGTLFAQSFDARALRLQGDPVPIAEGLAYNTGNGRATFSVSEGGVLAVRQGSAGGATLTQLLWFDRSGKETGAAAAPGADHTLGVSPDERQVAVDRHDENGSHDIWLLDLSRGTASRFTFDPGNDRWPVWSPDGKQIVFASDRSGSSDLYLKAASGAGQDEPLLKSSINKAPTDWAADGRFIVYESADPKTREDLWTLSLSGDRKPTPFAQTEFRERQGQLSPDGRWMAYTSDETGRDEVYVQPFPAPGGKWQISTGGGTRPRWRVDGKELFYLAADSKIMGVEVQAGSTFRAGVPRALFAARMDTTRISGNQYAIARDGRRLLVSTLAEAARVAPITVIVNWVAALKKP